MNPVRRKMFHILSNNKENQQEIKKIESAKPTVEVAVELSNTEQEFVQQEIKVEMPQISVEEPVVEEPVVEEPKVEAEEVKPQLSKAKKSKKDVEAGQE